MCGTEGRMRKRSGGPEGGKRGGVACCWSQRYQPGHCPRPAQGPAAVGFPPPECVLLLGVAVGVDLVFIPEIN